MKQPHEDVTESMKRVRARMGETCWRGLGDLAKCKVIGTQYEAPDSHLYVTDDMKLPNRYMGLQLL